MGNKNYTNYSNNKNKPENKHEETNTEFAVTEEIDGVHIRPVINGEIIDTPVEQIIQPEQNQENIDDQSDEPEQNTVTPEGIVDCEKLYVRKEATTNSEPITIINKSEEVSIDLNESTEDFYKVHTVSGIEGYCMKKYINVK